MTNYWFLEVTYPSKLGSIPEIYLTLEAAREAANRWVEILNEGISIYYKENEQSKSEFIEAIKVKPS